MVYRIATILSLIILSASCLQQPTSNTSRAGIASADVYYSLVLEQNPIVKSGNASYLPQDGIIPLLEEEGVFITSESFLDYDCVLNSTTYTIGDCFEVYGTDTGIPAQTEVTNGDWQFDPSSELQFYEVNTFHLVRKGLEAFYDGIRYAQSKLYTSGGTLTIPPVLPYNIDALKSFWLFNTDGSSQNMRVYSLCDITGNAFFDSSVPEICIGLDPDISGFYLAQDPSLIYHELAHAIVKIMMNQRNIYYSDRVSTSSVTSMRSDLGTLFYDEAGAINEGFADFFSYLITGRSHFAEWALGRFYSASRPLTESDSLHASGISTDDDSRLRYPTYVLYDPNFPTEGLEAVHYAGQITSHYFYSLAEKLKANCSIDHSTMRNWMILLFSETLGEIGDLTSYGSDYYDSSNNQTFFVNFNQDNSFDWTQMVKPPSFRRFFQIFAKNIYHHISHPVTGLCSSGFSKDDSEQLLDIYGLLLFDHYDDFRSASNGDSINYDNFDSLLSFSFSLTSWTENFSYFSSSSTRIDYGNRAQTVMIPKDLIDLPESTDSRAEAVLIDNPSSIQSFINFLLFNGYDANPTPGLSGTTYNNGNVKFSPGEVVAMTLNLVNNSNSEMGGIQVLASDWDHMGLENSTTGNLLPCTIDGFPSTDDGGNSGTDCSTVSTTGATHQAVSGVYPENTLNPICFVQTGEANETQWINQSTYATSVLSLNTSTECLNFDDSVNFDPNSCLVRFLPGAQQAFYSKINPQQTWLETQIAEGNPSPSFNYSGVMLMEINKKVPPGTLFNCRFRVRFTNCSDCYMERDDSDYTDDREYSDYEYTGHQPFKVINFQFRVLD